MCKISVIIPCYNSFKYMNNCLKSLKNQTFKDFEVIFIDDCSTDSTYSELQQYLYGSKLNYQLIKNCNNCGPGTSRNNGISISNGEYLCFMDSDDWYENDFVERMYNKAYRESLDIVMCDYLRVYDNDKKKYISPTENFTASMTKSNFLALSFDSLCCMLIKKSLFESIKIPAQFNAEDVAVIPILISKADKIGYISKPLYNYFYRIGSLSTNINSKKDIATSIEKAYEYICSNISDEFMEEKEFLGIKNILYGAVVCAFESEKEEKYIKLIINKFEEKYPSWYENKYIKYLPKSKRLFVYSIKSKSGMLMKLLIIIRKLLFKFKLA